jgi:hypothetical protein
MHKVPLQEPVERGIMRTFPSDPLVAWYDICKREPPLGIDFRGEGSPDGEEDCCHFHAGTLDKSFGSAHNTLKEDRVGASVTANTSTDLQSESGNAGDDVESGSGDGGYVDRFSTDEDDPKTDTGLL